ncbi:hypothetical protein H072_10615 [Dactylellina haptotyla CBS 200.50]|uniref:Apple domain-containing protein n=1 Tax=Dactylellina haptotyla (strain CBS 200.50) TaxID=1284197 RepID=S7ZZR4_DACHA|nr:hypothetical protein H072_10615 [Dactylellina haptotyla CBS 200.50]
MLFLQVLITFIVPLVSAQCVPWSTPGTCTPSSSSCTFYNCLENKSNCGPTGYALGFALPFCDAITTASTSLSTNGQAWYSATKYCLQNALTTEASCQTSCQDIYTNAFASHIPCYIDSGFCTLNGHDLKIFFQIVGVNGTVSNDGLALFGAVLQQCMALYQNGDVSGGWVEWLYKTLNGDI